MDARHPDGASHATRETRAAAWDRWAFAIAFAAWVAATVSTCFFVALYTTPIPSADDLELVQLIDPDKPPSWQFLWSQANEHRVLLPRLVYWGLLSLTHDFRSAMFFQVAVQSVLALSLILFVRRLRGRSSFADAFFPMLLLHWGEAGNLVLGLQIATAMSTALVCAFVMLAMRRNGPPGMGAALGMSACILLLTLDGGFGLMQLPALMLWTAASAWWLLRRGDGASRRTAVALITALVLAVGVGIFYFVDFFFPEALPHAKNPVDILRTVLQFLSVNFGPAAELWPVWAQILTVLFAGAAVWFAVRAWRRGADRWRVAAVLAGMAASFTIALSIGVSRGALSDTAGLSNRYVILPAPFFVAAWLGLALFAPRRIERIVQGLVCLAFVAVQPTNFAFGTNYGTFHRYLGKHLVEALRAGVPLDEYAKEHSGGFYPDPDGFCARFDVLRRAHYPPYVPEEQDPEWGAFDENAVILPKPRSIVSGKPAGMRIVAGIPALTIWADSEIVIEPPAAARRLDAIYGMLPIAWEGTFTNSKRSGGVRVAVEWRVDGAEPRILFERELLPIGREEDRGPQRLHVAIPEERPGRIVLTTRHVSEERRQLDWSFWRDVRAY